MDKERLYEKLDEDESLTDIERREIYFSEISEEEDEEENDYKEEGYY